MKNHLLLTKVTKSLLDIIFYIAPIIWILLPVLFHFILMKYYHVSSFNYVFFSIVFMIAGVFVWLILYELRCMLKSVLLKDPFVTRNVVSLKRMGRYAFIISICMLVTLLCYLNFSTFLLSIVFFIAGLFSLVLSIVFQEAVQYKQENDLTI